jgi:hypothetical protein
MAKTTVAAPDYVFDLSSDLPPIRFKIDDDVFEAVREIPALLALDFAQRAEKIGDALEDQVSSSEMITIIRGVFELVLLDESVQRLLDRLSDKNNPISVERMTVLVQRLFEVYGLRPTEPASD